MSRKGENIYKRKDNRWEARYIKGHMPDGSIHYGYCYGKTYREAKEKVTLAKAAFLNNQTCSVNKKRKRFSVYCEEWLSLNHARFKESTYVKYRSMLDKHIKPAFGGYFVQELTSFHIEEFSSELLYKKELSVKSVRDILITLHAILSYTAKQLPVSMPMPEVVYPKETKKEMRVLSREEQFCFTQYLLTSTDECKFGVLLALMTGLRIGELCALKWADISLERQTLRVSSTMQRLKNFDSAQLSKTKIVISEPKSARSARIIPLTDSIVKICDAWKSEDAEAFVLTGSRRYMEPRTLQYRLKRYVNECGLNNVHFHILRHTFATRCVEVGFEIKSLSEILGHANPKFTLERYVHSSLELKRENMDKLTMIGS